MVTQMQSDRQTGNRTLLPKASRPSCTTIISNQHWWIFRTKQTRSLCNTTHRMIFTQPTIMKFTTNNRSTILIRTPTKCTILSMQRCQLWATTRYRQPVRASTANPDFITTFRRLRTITGLTRAALSTRWMRCLRWRICRASTLFWTHQFKWLQDSLVKYFVCLNKFKIILLF